MKLNSKSVILLFILALSSFVRILIRKFVDAMLLISLIDDPCDPRRYSLVLMRLLLNLLLLTSIHVHHGLTNVLGGR